MKMMISMFIFIMMLKGVNSMSSEELEAIVERHKKWLAGEEGGVKANLRDVNLTNMDLSDFVLCHADLRGANLSDAVLHDADLTKADLRGAILRGTDLRGANLKCAILDYATLPLWCGLLNVNMDDAQVIQLLYHVLNIVKYSNNVSSELKEKLLTKDNLEITSRFHRASDYEEIIKYM